MRKLTLCQYLFRTHLGRFTISYSTRSLHFNFFRQLLNIAGGPLRILGGHAMDFYYIPVHLVEKFSQIAKLFLKHGVFGEVTTTTISSCLEDRPHFDIRFFYDWTSVRDTPWIRFNNFTRGPGVVFHPSKWSTLLKPNEKNFTKCVGFYCRTVLSWLHGIKPWHMCIQMCIQAKEQRRVNLLQSMCLHPLTHRRAVQSEEKLNLGSVLIVLWSESKTL